MNKEAKDSLFDTSMVFEDCAIEVESSRSSKESISPNNKFESADLKHPMSNIKCKERFAKLDSGDLSAERRAKVKYVRTAKSPQREKRGDSLRKKQSSNSKHPFVSQFIDKENMPLLVSKVRKVEELKKNSTQTKEVRHFEKAEQLLQWRDAKDKKVEQKRKEFDLELARSRSKKRLSSKEITKSSERLYETAFILEKKKEITAKAFNEFSFKPQINPKSIEMVKNQQIRYASRPSHLLKQTTSIPKMLPGDKTNSAIIRSSSKDPVRAKQSKPNNKRRLMSDNRDDCSPSKELLDEDQHVFCTTQDECEESTSVNQEMKIEGVYDSEPRASNITETEDDPEYASTIEMMHQLRCDGDISVDVYEDHRLLRDSNALERNQCFSINPQAKEFSFMMSSAKDQVLPKKHKHAATDTSGKRETTVEKYKSRDSSIKSSKSRSVAIIPTDIGELSLANSCSAEKQQLSSPLLQAKEDKREVLAAIDLIGSFSSKKTPHSNLGLVPDKKQSFADKKHYKQRDLLEIMRNLCQDVDNTMQYKNN